jgi:hypothetical protein
MHFPLIDTARRKSGMIFIFSTSLHCFERTSRRSILHVFFVIWGVGEGPRILVAVPSPNFVVGLANRQMLGIRDVNALLL